MKRIAAYLRVSTDKQSTDSQLLAIKTEVERSGDTLVQIYSDEGISGGKGRAQRPGLDAVLNDASANKFDKVVCFDITRLGRSLADLIGTLNELQRSNVDLQFLQNNLDTSTAGGRMLFSIFGAIGEFEKSLIRERVMAGQQRAKAAGVKLGRPSKMNDGMRNAIKILREKGMGIKQIAKQLGVGIGTVYSVI